MTPPDLSLVLIMLLFWVTFWLVQRFLVRPVGRVLAERRGRIDGAEKEWSSKHQDYLSATSRLERELEDAARAAGAIRADHRHRANQARQALLDEAHATADTRLEGALATLADEAEAARQELRRHAADLARLFAGQLLGREVRS